MSWKRIIIYLIHFLNLKLVFRFPVEEQFFAQRRSEAIKSIRQAAEWGMGSVSKVSIQSGIMTKAAVEHI